MYITLCFCWKDIGGWERFLGFGRASTDGKQKHALKMGGRDLRCFSLPQTGGIKRDFDICIKLKSAYKRQMWAALWRFRKFRQSVHGPAYLNPRIYFFDECKLSVWRSRWNRYLGAPAQVQKYNMHIVDNTFSFCAELLFTLSLIVNAIYAIALNAIHLQYSLQIYQLEPGGKTFFVSWTQTSGKK